MDFQYWASMRSERQEQRRGSQQHLILLGTTPHPQHADSRGGIFSGGLQGLAPVPRRKRGSLKESQKQKFAKWLLWFWGRAVVKCSTACRAAGQRLCT